MAIDTALGEYNNAKDGFDATVGLDKITAAVELITRLKALDSAIETYKSGGEKSRLSKVEELGGAVGIEILLILNACRQDNTPVESIDDAEKIRTLSAILVGLASLSRKMFAWKGPDNEYEILINDKRTLIAKILYPLQDAREN